MMPATWPRRALLAAYVLIVAAVLAHTLAAVLSPTLATLPTSMDSLPPTASPVAIPEASDAKVLADLILTAGLFVVPETASGQPGGSGGPSGPPQPPLNVAKQVRLLGTVVDAGTGGRAILEDLASKQQKLVHLHDTVSTIGMIAQVEKDRVLFRQGSQEEWLPLAIDTLAPGFTYTAITVAQSALARPAASARPLILPPAPVGPTGRRMIARGVLSEAVKDLSLLSAQARPVPSMVNGRSEGIRLEAVNHYSLYGHLGFQSGDVVSRINGVELRDPTMLATLIQRMQNERTIRIDLYRNREPTTLTVDIS